MDFRVSKLQAPQPITPSSENVPGHKSLGDIGYMPRFGKQAAISLPVGPYLVLQSIRDDFTDAWHAYLDQGVKFFSIPIEVSEREDYVSDDTFEILTLNFWVRPGAPSSWGSVVSNFEYGHKQLRLTQERIDRLLPASHHGLAGNELARLEGFCDDVREDVAESSTAVEELVAAKNAVAARGELSRDEPQGNELELKFKEWAKMVKAAAKGMTGEDTG
ncbi:hypothetical protein LTR85_002344 [Meristemomyces frigidus]|nr:hypothetical protein LTR85_002344 [Meristemomyces frigidus]